MLDIFLLSFATLFVIIDPIGIAPISVTLTAGQDFRAKKGIIIRAALVAFIILLIFGLIGEAVLQKIGIGLPAFRISGGMLLFLTALEILFEKRQARRSQQEQVGDPTIFPLALPLMAGPGAMTSMILLTGEHSGEPFLQLAVYISMLSVMLITIAMALSANRFSHLLGDAGMQILNRLLGVLLAALAIQFIADGILEYVQGIS